MAGCSRLARGAIVVLLVLGLSACAPLAPEPDVPEAEPEPPPPPAVLALAERAEAQKDAGAHEAAAASLERALRMSPRNAELWHRLAEIRLLQGQWRAAESLAFRSLGLELSEALRRANWQLIAAARTGSGDDTGAREAEAQLAR